MDDNDNRIDHVGFVLTVLAVVAIALYLLGFLTP